MYNRDSYHLQHSCWDACIRHSSLGPGTEQRLRKWWLSLLFLLFLKIYSLWASQVALAVINLTASAGDARAMGSILDQEDPLGKEMATHSSILSWKIPWTEEPGGPQSMGSQRGRHD